MKDLPNGVMQLNFFLIGAIKLEKCRAVQGILPSRASKLEVFHAGLNALFSDHEDTTDYVGPATSHISTVTVHTEDVTA